MRISFFLFVCLWTGRVYSQTTFSVDSVAHSITVKDLRKHLYAIATDSMEGRETGEKGQKVAADYLKNHFNALNIPPVKTLKDGYLQEFPLQVMYAKGGKISTPTKTFDYKKDFYYPKITSAQDLKASEVCFLGFGIDDEIYSDYKDIDCQNALGIIFPHVPSKIEKKGRASEWTANWRVKLEKAAQKGLKALCIVDDNLAQTLQSNAHFIEAPHVKLLSDTAQDKFIPVFYISPALANHLLKLNGDKDIRYLKKRMQKRSKPRSFKLNHEIILSVERRIEYISSENVLGYIEGTDKKEELIVLTAHYDHLGKHEGEIYYGADDDGSGTVALLEMAEAFQLAKNRGFGPRRSILIMPVSGEEKGLLGSSYYSENPVFPLSNTVANLNIDMIGRMDKEHEGDPNYIYLIGSDKLSQDLHQISENTNKKYTQLALDYRYNDEKDPNRFYYRSDHWNFAKHDIPVIFYFNGVHDDYHKPTDTVDKIHFEKMEKITRLVFYTAWDLANREERIRLDKKDSK